LKPLEKVNKNRCHEKWNHDYQNKRCSISDHGKSQHKSHSHSKTHPLDYRGSAANVTSSAFYYNLVTACGPIASDESKIMFLPERSTICQYRPEISITIVKKQWRERLPLAHPVLYILKTQKTCCTF